MKYIIILLLIQVSSYSIGQSNKKALKVMNDIETVDQVISIQKKQPKWNMELIKLDSIDFVRDMKYRHLTPGNISQFGSKDGRGSDLYKLLKVSTDSIQTNSYQFFILHIHLN